MSPEPQGPLTETVYYVLLALDSPLHGYGVMQQVAQMSGGRVNLGPGTLYGALTTLVEKDWISPVGSNADTRKKEYVLTETGRAVLRTELTRLQELLRNGRSIIERDAK